jgi:hypothetical protein
MLEPFTNPAVIQQIMIIVAGFEQCGASRTYESTLPDDAAEDYGGFVTVFLALKVVNRYRLEIGQEPSHDTILNQEEMVNLFTYDQQHNKFVFDASYGDTLQQGFTQLKSSCKITIINRILGKKFTLKHSSDWRFTISQYGSINAQFTKKITPKAHGFFHSKLKEHDLVQLRAVKNEQGEVEKYQLSCNLSKFFIQSEIHYKVMSSVLRPKCTTDPALVSASSRIDDGISSVISSFFDMRDHTRFSMVGSNRDYSSAVQACIDVFADTLDLEDDSEDKFREKITTKTNVTNAATM